MLNRTSLLVLATAVSALVGCVMPEPVLRLTPVSESIVYYEGRAAEVKQGASVRVAAAFEREYMQGSQHLVGFRVEVENTSDRTLLVDPSRFYYAACARSPSWKSRTCQPSHSAIDPERLLLTLDMEHTRHQASTANQEAFAAALVFLDLAAAVTSASSGHPRSTAAALRGAAAAAAIGAGAQVEGTSEAATYEMVRSMWSTEALRKTTLPPGQGAAGLVFVDRALGASEIVLALRVGDETVSTSFRQTQINVDRRQ